MVPKSGKNTDFSLKVCDPPEEEGWENQVEEAEVEEPETEEAEIDEAETDESDSDEELIDIVLCTDSDDSDEEVQEYFCLMAKKGDKQAEIEDLPSTYSEYVEVYSNPDIDVAAQLQYLHEKAIKWEKNKKLEKMMTAKWEASSKQNHALVVELSDKNAQNDIF